MSIKIIHFVLRQTSRFYHTDPTSRFPVLPLERFPHASLLSRALTAAGCGPRCSPAGTLLQVRVAVQQRAGVPAVMLRSLRVIPLSHHWKCSEVSNVKPTEWGDRCRGPVSGGRPLSCRWLNGEGRCGHCCWAPAAPPAARDLSALRSAESSWSAPTRRGQSQYSPAVTWPLCAASTVSGECRNNGNQNKTGLWKRVRGAFKYTS